MVNQQKRVQQETAYNAVVVNDYMYPCPYIVFDPNGVMESNDISRDGDTYEIATYYHHSLQLLLVFASLSSFHDICF